MFSAFLLSSDILVCNYKYPTFGEKGKRVMMFDPEPIFSGLYLLIPQGDELNNSKIEISAEDNPTSSPICSEIGDGVVYMPW